MAPQAVDRNHPHHPLSRADVMIRELGQGFRCGGPDQEGWSKIAEEANELLSELSERVNIEPEAKELWFRLLLIAGDAAQNGGYTGPPYYVEVGDMMVNAHWYTAGAVCAAEPQWLNVIVMPEVHASVSYYTQLIHEGILPPAP